jgi:hypothetical protein
MTTEESTTATNEENLVVEEKRETKGTLRLAKKEVEEKETVSSIPYDRFKKVNEEKKALAEKVAEFERLQKEANDKKLAEEGRYKELLEAKEKELADLNSNIEKERATRKRDNLLNKINLKAQERGAIDFEDIKKFLDIDGLIDSDNEAIDKELNQLQETKSYLFGNKKKSATDENNIDFRGSGEKKPTSVLGSLAQKLR